MEKHNNLLHDSTASLSSHDQYESGDSIQSSFSNLLSAWIMDSQNINEYLLTLITGTTNTIHE